VFLEAGGAMRQMKTPKSTFLYKTLYRNVLLLLHNAVVVFVVFLIFGVMPGWPFLVLPVGLALLLANVGWMVLVAGDLTSKRGARQPRRGLPVGRKPFGVNERR
jgi:ABC-2 type transport system permease protein